jgi:glycosyltransferase involved in cell wall biosynthesis
MSAVDLRPRLGRRPATRARERFLFVCFFDPSGIATICENIALWQSLSRYPIDILNMWPGRDGTLALPANIDLTAYDGLIVHCTASYHPDNLYSLDRDLPRKLDEYDGVKVLMKQDEHYRTAKFAEFVGEKKFDVVLTLISPADREKIYPRAVVGEADFVEVYTGYVSPFMRKLDSPAPGARPIDISYRGSIQPLSLGRLGFEKRKIGYDVAAAADYPLKIDISSRWADRIGGTAWFDFLGRSRAVLGVESGTCLCDFTGEVEAWCNAFEKAHPEADHLSEEFYRDADRAYLHQFEGNFKYLHMSPRHLEAAATRSLQILYEGTYSGVLLPDRHFVPLRRDLANFAEAVDFLRDDRRVAEMVECAYEEIVRNPRLQYAAFVERFDEAVDRALSRKGRAAAAVSGAPAVAPRPRALVLAGHEPTLDPRIEWMAEGLTRDFAVCELGIHPLTLENRLPDYELLREGWVRTRVDRLRHVDGGVPDIAAMSSTGQIGLQHLMLLRLISDLPPKALADAIGAIDATEEDLGRFRWLVRHYYDTNCALLEAGRRTGVFDAIVAADMGTLPAALALAEEYGAKVLYDAHEFWPRSVMEFRHWEVEFWSAFDRNLAQRADLRVTVSPQLAEVMAREYGCDFLSLPNCVSRGSVPPVDLDAALQRSATREQVVFIFLGVFTTGRGIEDLIAAWRQVDRRGLLVLQGPEGAFRSDMIELARAHGMLDERVFFPPAVDTSELIDAARQADVGIIPYAPSSINNRYCSPNKLSQYMAAGLPIVANETEFVKSVILDSGAGTTVDFKDQPAFAAVINGLIDDPRRIAEMSRRAYRYFNQKFNWEAASTELYGKLNEAVGGMAPPARPPFDFSWTAVTAPPPVAAAKVPPPVPRAQPAETAVGIGASGLKQLGPAYEREFARLTELNENYRREIERLNAVLGPLRTATTPLRFLLRQWRQIRQPRAGRQNKDMMIKKSTTVAGILAAISLLPLSQVDQAFAGPIRYEVAERASDGSLAPAKASEYRAAKPDKDENGVVSLISEDGRRYYHAFNVATQALADNGVEGTAGLYLDAMVEKNPIPSASQTAALKWIVKNKTDLPGDAVTWTYPLPLYYRLFTVEPGWPSAFSQARIIHALIYGSRTTKDPEYLKLAVAAAKAYATPAESGGLRSAVDGLPFYEEVPVPDGHSPHILNGHLYSVAALYDLAKETGDASIKALADAGAASTEKLVSYYDTGYWTKYDLLPRVTDIVFLARGRGRFEVKQGTIASPEGKELPLRVASVKGEDILLQANLPGPIFIDNVAGHPGYKIRLSYSGDLDAVGIAGDRPDIEEYYQLPSDGVQPSGEYQTATFSVPIQYPSNYVLSRVYQHWHTRLMKRLGELTGNAWYFRVASRWERYDSVIEEDAKEVTTSHILRKEYRIPATYE